MYSSSVLIRMAVIATLVLAPTVALLLARRRIGVLNAAAWLVIYGSAVIAGEHTFIGLALLLELNDLPGLGEHPRFHFFMGGVYTFVGAVLLGVVAWTLLRTGSRGGWYAILFGLVLGGGLELLAANTIFPHGFPPRSIPLGLSLYAYIPAFASALAISYGPIFRKGSLTAGWSGVGFNGSRRCLGMGVAEGRSSSWKIR